MVVTIRDINTGKVINKRSGFPAVQQLSDDAGFIQAKALAERLYQDTSEHPNCVYWVCSREGIAIHKQTF